MILCKNALIINNNVYLKILLNAFVTGRFVTLTETYPHFNSTVDEKKAPNLMGAFGWNSI